MSDLSRAASCLADLAHALESGSDADARVRRALARLRHVVPHERCALLDLASDVAPRVFFDPAGVEADRRRMEARAEVLLKLVADRGARGGAEPISVAPNGRGMHLAVPLISLDEIAGVLLVERDEGEYGEQDLQMLSVVASQLGAYFTSLRLQRRQQETAEELRQALARQTHFLGLLSHELRNPLAPIGNAVFILDRVDPGGEQARRARGVIARQFQHLSRLVDDLLDATRVTSGKVHLHRTRVDLADVVQSTVEDHRSVFARSEVELSIRIRRSPLWVDGDPTRLSQVVGNLLSNSVKFTRPGGRTEVVVDQEPPATAVVRVRDDGAGISSDVLKRLFEPFAQGDDTLDRSRGGLGLGLALAKGLLELHRGSIDARSDGVGRGAEFTVRLPLVVDEAPVSRRDSSAAAIVAGPRRVLLLEDNVDAAQTLRDVLRLAGHTVEIAHDARAGLELLPAFEPDVVLCDIGLPGMSGYDVARELRSSAQRASLLLVALTGYGSDEDRHRALDAGFDAHLVKPVAPEALENVLRVRVPLPGPAARDPSGVAS